MVHVGEVAAAISLHSGFAHDVVRPDQNGSTTWHAVV
jgi:hypothetical protein